MSQTHPGDDILCDHCDKPGVPYEYKGRQFSGLTANRGERLCRTCLDITLSLELASMPDPGVSVYWKGGRVYASTQTNKALGVPKGMSREEFRKGKKT